MMESKSLCCNVCSQLVDGIAYRTICKHLICPVCSQHAFTRGNTCPVCNDKLSQDDVTELVVGMKVSQSFLDFTLQSLFQSSNWEAIINSHYQISNSIAQMTSLLMTQLTIEGAKDDLRRMTYDKEIKKLNDEIITIQKYNENCLEELRAKNKNLERMIHSYEQESSELKDAYKEKARKCSAWEKAYGALRDQVIGQSNNQRDEGTTGANAHAPGTDVQDPRIASYNAYQQQQQQLSLRNRTEITTMSRSTSEHPSYPSQPSLCTAVDKRKLVHSSDAHTEPQKNFSFTKAANNPLKSGIDCFYEDRETNRNALQNGNNSNNSVENSVVNHIPNNFLNSDSSASNPKTALKHTSQVPSYALNLQATTDRSIFPHRDLHQKLNKQLGQELLQQNNSHPFLSSSAPANKDISGSYYSIKGISTGSDHRSAGIDRPIAAASTSLRERVSSVKENGFASTRNNSKSFFDV